MDLYKFAEQFFFCSCIKIFTKGQVADMGIERMLVSPYRGLHFRVFFGLNFSWRSLGEI